MNSQLMNIDSKSRTLDSGAKLYGSQNNSDITSYISYENYPLCLNFPVLKIGIRIT